MSGGPRVNKGIEVGRKVKLGDRRHKVGKGRGGVTKSQVGRQDRGGWRMSQGRDTGHGKMANGPNVHPGSCKPKGLRTGTGAWRCWTHAEAT